MNISNSNSNNNQSAKESSKKNGLATNNDSISNDYQIDSEFNFIDYKGCGNLQSTHQLFFQEDSPDPEVYPNYSILYEQCDKLKSDDSPKSIVNFLKFTQKTYRLEQNMELLNIFEEFDLFQIIINFVLSENIDVSIEALKFINNFTSKNDDFAQLFIERNLFGLLSNIITRHYPSDWSKNIEPIDYQYFILSLSIFANLSQFKKTYFQRVWKILSPNLFFTIINHGNTDSLRYCALIAMRSIQRSNDLDQTNVNLIKSILEKSLKGLFTLLNHQDFKIIEYSLFGILKYFDINKQLFFEPKIFSQIRIYPLLENFYKSNQYNELIKAHSLSITAQLLYHGLIDNFYSESIYDLLIDNFHLKLKENAFYCLYMAIFKNKLADQPLFLEFLKENITKILLECRFTNLYYVAYAIIIFIEKLGINDFMSILNDNMILAIIKLIQFEDQEIQLKTLCLLSKFPLEDDVIAMFTEFGGAEALSDILKSDNDDLRVLCCILNTKYNLGI